MSTPLAEIEPLSSRLDQLSNIKDALIDGHPLMVHGSLAHAAVRGASLPPVLKRFGEVRDIDVFTQGKTGKLVVEAVLNDLGLASPCPVDAGLTGLLIRDSGGNLAAHKNDVTVEIDDPEGLFDQDENYEIVGGDGLTLRSFTPEGLLAVHSLEPEGRLSHFIPDMLFETWCERQGVVLPDATAASIAEFHKAYKAKYPYGVALRYTSDIYTSILPERVRSHFRLLTHKIMRKYTGRENPFE